MLISSSIVSSRALAPHESRHPEPTYMSERLLATRRKRLATCLLGATAACGASLFLWACTQNAAPPAAIKPPAPAPVLSEAEINGTFTATVHPFLDTYCAGCHSGATPEAGFDV